ncbi:hypothetical protein LTR17_013125 [Elasticomyces elasticus]|nr:hypothetical protein LTR17_013125 [Elasticomyces elasticus]
MELSTSLGGAVEVLQDRILSLMEGRPENRRILIALAGVPGSGKSTITAALLAQLEYAGVRNAVVVPMDGYHYTKARLASFQDPGGALRRRGAPFTFDAQSFLNTVVLLHGAPAASHDNSTEEVWIPGFDHAVQDPVPNDVCIPATTRIIMIEGNYVLLDQPPWRQIATMVDERWFVDTSRHIAKHRIAKRHVNAGIEHTLEAAEQRAEENDLPNGDLIRAKLLSPDVVIKND